MAAMLKAQQSQEPAGWLTSPLGWAAATAATGLIAYGLVQPSACSDVPQCAVKHEAISTNLNTYAAYGLMMVLVGETANLVSTYKGAQEAQSMIPDLRSRCLPSLLLVMSFLVLICESSIYASGSDPWFSSSRPDLKEPVFTATFVEWLIIVPMLLVMAGYCALGRPMEELGRPIVVTNVYIIMSWAALLTTDFVLRWSLVLTTFGMYFWASWDMILWVGRYLQAAPADLSSRFLRPCLSLGLIALFAVYAVVYMSVLFGVMAPKTERVTFLFLNVGSKLCFSIAFVVIRGNEYHSTLTGVLRKLSTSNVAIVSILRGSFDILLPCLADSKGHCRLPAANSGDMAQLEHALQRPVAGMALAELMPDEEERVRFAAYVRNAHRQAAAPPMQAVGGSNWAVQVGGALPPVAQVLNCHLVAAGAGGQPAILSCAVHLSVVPSSSWGLGRQMVAAVRFTDESTAARPEEAVPAPEFKAFNGSHGKSGESAQASSETRSQSDGQSQSQSASDDMVVASLMDVARLGMSALLRSNRSVAGDGEEADSGYDDGSSYVQPRQQQQQQQQSVPDFNMNAKRSVGTRSVISEESEDSISVRELNMKSVVKAVKPASVCSSQGGGMSKLTTLREPEEERFSRNTTPTPQQEAERSHYAPSERSMKPKTFSSVGAAVTAAAQELLGSEAAADPKSNVTVTMSVAPMQFGLAVGTLALAATVSLLGGRRRA